MIPNGPVPAWLAAVRAAEDKKGTAIRVHDLRGMSSFADYFVICSGGNQRQVQAIAGEIERVMKQRNDPPVSVEGFTNAEWILMDFGDMVVNIFAETARSYYDLDRLYRDARLVDIPAAPQTAPAAAAVRPRK